jgi:FkbM family methyltransferase
LFPVAERSPDIRVIGVEPIPGLVEYLRNKSLALELDNIEVWPYAIDTEARTAKFNLSLVNQSGVSSLLDFDAETLARHEYWAQRSDLVMDEGIEVEVRRLDELLSAAGIERVRFVKIDAQGLDLNVLESAGAFTECIDAGVLEVPTVHNARLYEGEPTLRDALDRLDTLGFEVYAIKPNDPATAEVNIFFCRNGVDWRELETTLHLRGIPLYDGKHYWHHPSESPQPRELAPQDSVADAGQAIDREIRVENAMAWAALGRERRHVEELEREIAELRTARATNPGPAEVGKSASRAPRRPLPIRFLARLTRPLRRRVGAVRK